MAPSGRKTKGEEGVELCNHVLTPLPWAKEVRQAGSKMTEVWFRRVISVEAVLLAGMPGNMSSRMGALVFFFQWPISSQKKIDGSQGQFG